MAETRPSDPILVPYPEEEFLRSDALMGSVSIGTDPSAAYPELARTNAARYTQHYLHEGSQHGWQDLTASQGAESRLRPRTYMELSQLSHETMPDPESYEAVQYINAIHDICKNPEIMREVGLDPGHDSHDEGLRRLFLPEHEAVRRHYLPSYDDDSFSDNQRRVIEGVLTSPFNFIRFVQSQASEHEIESLRSMPRDILQASIMHGIHDLGGAMGHKNETTSLTLDEPAATRLLDAAYALLGTAEELTLPEDTDVTPKIRQRAYLMLRAARLGMTAPDTPTETAYADALAKLTVADLLRCYSPEDFATPQAAFDRLPDMLRTTWSTIHALPIQSPETAGRFEGQGTEYAPAFLRSLGRDEDSMYASLGYFAQICSIANAWPYMEASHRGAEEMPTASPYRTINFRELAEWSGVKENAERAKTTRTSIPMRFVVSGGDTITPVVVSDYDPSDPNTVLVSHPTLFELPQTGQ